MTSHTSYLLTNYILRQGILMSWASLELRTLLTQPLVLRSQVCTPLRLTFLFSS